VSVAILASVLTGIMLMLSYSIKSDSEAKMRTTAKDLIQEGTDILRRERDRLGWSMMYDQLDGLDGSEFVSMTHMNRITIIFLRICPRVVVVHLL